MDTKATTLLAKLFGNDGRTIPYRPEVARVVGGIGAAILLQQIVYRANGSNFEAFYKFKEPCTHHLYREGDSWTEELGFNRREFDNALQSIAVKRTAKVTMEDALKAAQEQYKPVLYWTNASRVTFYRVEIEILVTVLSQAYDQKRKSDFSKSAKQTLDQKAESDFIRSESSTRLPEEKEPPMAASPPAALRQQLDGLLEHDPDALEAVADSPVEDSHPDPSELCRPGLPGLLPLIDAPQPAVDDSEETADLFNPPKPSSREPVEQGKARRCRELGTDPLGVAAVVVQNRAAVANPDWTDALAEWGEWLDRPVREWCALTGLPYDAVPEPRKHYFATELSRIATTQGMHKTPEQASDAIRVIARNKDDYGWLRSAGSPKHRGFEEAFLNVLCGQTLPEGKRNGSTGGRAQREQVISSDTVVM